VFDVREQKGDAGGGTEAPAALAPACSPWSRAASSLATTAAPFRLIISITTQPPSAGHKTTPRYHFTPLPARSARYTRPSESVSYNFAHSFSHPTLCFVLLTCFGAWKNVKNRRFAIRKSRKNFVQNIQLEILQLAQKIKIYLNLLMAIMIDLSINHNF